MLNTPILHTGPLNSVYPLANIAEHGPFIEDLNMIDLSNMVIFRKKRYVQSPNGTFPSKNNLEIHTTKIFWSFVSVLFCLVGSSKTRRFTKNTYELDEN